jgi:hypothetical protein
LEFGEEESGKKLKRSLEGLDKASSVVCHVAEGAGFHLVEQNSAFRVKAK